MTRKAKKAAGNSGKQRGRPFKPGQSGNPAGRPPLPEEVREQITTRFLAGNMTAIDRLEQLMQSDDENVALKATLGWLAKTIKDGMIIELVGKNGEALKVALEESKETNVDPARAVRLVAMLAQLGALPVGFVGVGGGNDAAPDEVHEGAADGSAGAVPPR